MQSSLDVKHEERQVLPRESTLGPQTTPSETVPEVLECSPLNTSTTGKWQCQPDHPWKGPTDPRTQTAEAGCAVARPDCV